MVFHLRKEFLADATNSMKFLPSQIHNSLPSAIAENEKCEFLGELQTALNFPDGSSHRTVIADKSQKEAFVKYGSSREYNKLNGSA